MPTYEYQCSACGHQLEAFQKMTDDPLVNCPKCSQPSLNKLVSATSFQLKGTGWYVTDIRDKGKPKPQENESKTEASKNSDASAAKEKPETKKESTTTTTDKSGTSDSGASS